MALYPLCEVASVFPRQDDDEICEGGLVEIPESIHTNCPEEVCKLFGDIKKYFA